ncbi:MAG: protein kinase domain-containing protein [Acidobacteriota bacterium]
MQPGSRVAHFEILGLLGSGGMGEVWRARDTRLGRDVAIKVLPAEFAADLDRLRRFEQEARAVAALNHPNVLALYDAGTHEGTPYLVAELLEGESLRDRLLGGALPVCKAVEIGVQIAQGLAAAHEKGIIHRDLKPGNVFLTRDGQVKILDFGLAKLTPAQGRDEAGKASTVVEATEAGVVLGTVGYMAPEQVRGQNVDHRTDVFALGCVLYEMLAGRRPFGGATSADTAAAIISTDPPPLAATGKGIPQGLVAVVLRCLEKRPDDRFGSARDVAYTLLAVAQPLEPGGSSAAALGGQADDRPSVAVLPFTNLSADPEQEYFCDGMAEEIINALAHVVSLRVIARTSSFAFKGASRDVREIGDSLDVRSVLEGSVRRSGDRLRITAQLIDAADGSHLWSERFDRRLEDVFAIQDEIALAIVEKLRVQLLGGEKASVVRRRTESVEAHNAYLMALFEWNKMTPEGFARATGYFRDAIRLDPDFALAYAWSADALASPAWWADTPPLEAMVQALPLAEKALSLDPDLAHAHSAVGVCRAFFERDWVSGEHSLRRAVELAPSDATAQVYLALLLVEKRWNEEGAMRARLAQRLDPLSPAVNAWAGSFLVCAGQTGEGLATLEDQVARTPHLWMPRYFLSHALAVEGRLAEARSVAVETVELSGGLSLALAHLAYLCYLLGDRDAGDEPFERLLRRAEEGYVAPMLLAWIHVTRGEPEAAAQRVREALAVGDPWVTTHLLYSPSIIPPEPTVDALIATALP